MALLPNKDVSISDYIASLDARSISDMLGSAEEGTANIGLPKFSTEYSAELSKALSALGMPFAFDKEKADLSGLGFSEAGNLFIDSVIHKTFISVDELGTKAAAATGAFVFDTGFSEPKHSVILDRPFVYMLIDCETDLPFFIGVLMDPQA